MQCLFCFLDEPTTFILLMTTQGPSQLTYRRSLVNAITLSVILTWYFLIIIPPLQNHATEKIWNKNRTEQKIYYQHD